MSQDIQQRIRDAMASGDQDAEIAARQELQSLRKPVKSAKDLKEQKQLMKNLPNNTLDLMRLEKKKLISESVPGVSFDMIDVDEGAGSWFRTKMSFMDTDEEIQDLFYKNYPDGAITKFNNDWLFFYSKEDGGAGKEKLKLIDEVPGSWGDVADLAGPIAKTAPAAGVALATGGMGIPVSAALTGGTAALTSLANQGAQEIFGNNRQSGSDMAVQAGKEAGIDMLMAGGGLAYNKAANAATSRGILNKRVSPELRELSQNVADAQQQGVLDVENLTAAQQTNNQILKRIDTQAESMSSIDTKEKQLASAGRVLQDDGRSPNYKGDLRNYLDVTGRGILAADRKKLVETLIPNVSREKRGATVQSAIRDNVVKNSKKEVSGKYTTLDNYLENKNVVYDPRVVQDKLADVEQGIQAKVATAQTTPGNSQYTDLGSQNVQRIEGGLQSIINQTKQLRPNSTSFETLKALRTQAGGLIEDSINTGIDSSNAKRVYRILTELMENPANVDDAVKANVRALSQNAASAHAKRMDILNLKTLRSIYKKQNIQNIIDQFGKPTKMDTLFRESLDKYSPEGSRVFKEGIYNKILEADDPIAALNEWKYYPEQYAWLTKGREDDLTQVAQKVKELNQGNLARSVNEVSKNREVIDILVDTPGNTPQDVKLLVSQVGKERMNKAVYDHLFDQSVETMASGEFILNKNVYRELLSRYKKTGIWDEVLTAEDRVKFKGLDSYLSILSKRQSDPGASLEAAQAITNLKHPATFIQGVHQIGANKVAWMTLRSKVGRNLLIGKSAKEQFKKNWLGAIAIMYDGIEEQLDFRVNARPESLPAEMINIPKAL